MLYRLFISHWQWFALSMTICLCMAYLYTRYATPAYKLSAKVLIRQPDNPFHRASNRMLNVQQIGMVSKTQGVENEAERLWSSRLTHDVVKRLKLYTDYKEQDWPKDRQVYATQPVTVNLDPLHLDSLDKVAYNEFRSITVRMSKQNDSDSVLRVKGMLTSDGQKVWAFSRKLKHLPASIDTPFGTLTFTRNPQGDKMTADHYWQVTIVPPLYKALLCLGRLGVKQAKRDYSTIRAVWRYYYKMASIIELTFVDQDVYRGTDFLRQLVASYNSMATDENYEIARRSKDFIDDRITHLNASLGAVDSNIEGVLQSGGLTSLKDASQLVKTSDQYSTQMAEASVQVMLIDELRDYINNPANRYAVIPTSIGLKDGVALRLVNQYNAKVMERSNLLQSVSEEALPVKQLTAAIDDLHDGVVNALEQARHSIAVSREGISSQYAASKGRLSDVTTAEHALSDAKRDQLIRQRLYVLLLKKREDIIVALSSTANQGQLIDEPLYEGQVRPNLWKAYGIGLAVGLALPYAVLLLMGFFRYKIEGHEELARLTGLPIIADVPLSSQADKRKAGIVVQTDTSDPLNEVFRLMRYNLQFMVRGQKAVILFTSSTSGEGKTFNSANLAMSYALLEKRVVLCGLDIRKPALGRLFGLADHSRGITPLLAMPEVTEASVEEQLQPSGIHQRLDLLLAGPEAPNPAELLSRDSFKQVIAILRERYDYVILDTAPVGLVTDTLLISDVADITVFVCRAHYTPKYDIAQLNTLAEEKHLPNPCFVLNGQ